GYNPSLLRLAAKGELYMDPAGTRVIHRDLNRSYPKVVRGEGIYLYDDEGNRYIDGSGGTSAVTAIGHGVTGGGAASAVHTAPLTRSWQPPVGDGRMPRSCRRPSTSRRAIRIAAGSTRPVRRATYPAPTTWSSPSARWGPRTSPPSSPSRSSAPRSERSRRRPA